ncbi:MAG: anaerobic ribonucleoside-triphosphate reductase activating protein [Clostridiales bacterium]|jgi:pyruvate formate lyase activating enzyme|nr:anaerobic ribonucleoside-triphosphate reductase activating protein [Clostridiales bacterium]
MQIHGFIKSTLLDYPKHLAATVFVGGCNMRCPFCHNASLVLRPHTQPIISEDDIMSYLNTRKNILEGVCITGGEPTLYPDLSLFIEQIKELGLKVKLDTNGTNPSLMYELINKKLIDYVSMDIKNSKDKYKSTAGNKDISMDKIEESVSLLISNVIDYEFRTTIVNELHTEQDMKSIGLWIKGAKAYYLQAYSDSGDVISPGFTSPSKETLIQYKELLSPYVDYVGIRGVD